uniref:Replication protein VP4 n=1 Tax=Gokushovirinae environmental samples TaxID=1478972 RepID=A0A2R3UAL8_9VIRU|nr:replication protein VP4 [Gokushovirinae environmental samples]
MYPRDQLIVNGVACRPPKYYDILLERESPTILESLKLARVENAKKFSADNVPARLAVREKVARARLNFKVRTLE